MPNRAEARRSAAAVEVAGRPFVKMHGLRNHFFIVDARQAPYRPSRDEIVLHYAEASGRQVDDLDYYVILARWKLGVVLEQGYQRAGDDEKLQVFGPIVLELMTGAAELAETTDYRR